MSVNRVAVNYVIYFYYPPLNTYSGSKDSTTVLIGTLSHGLIVGSFYF
jgi:hypothetical protein